MFSRVRGARIAAPLAVAATLGAAGLTAGASGAVPVQSGATTLATINDAGQATTFTLQWASTVSPSSVVVIFHGHGHNAEEWQAAGELTTAAGRDNAVVVAPQTTETSAPNGKGTFDTVDEEARDAAAAIAWARATYHPRSTYLMCVSMGCTGMAYFIDALGRPAAGDPDASFVQGQNVGPITGIVVSEGLSNLVETWAEAAVADTTSQGEIEAETGGNPASAPAAYRSRSLALLRTFYLSRLHLQQAAVIHDVDDGLVPVNQAVETRAALAAARVPFHGYTVVRSGYTKCSTANQTTGTSYVGKYEQQYTGDRTVGNDIDKWSCLAGHATETHPETPVMHTSFDVLHTMTTTGVARGETPVGIFIQ
ncbi:MAG: hypothetical protein ACJ735_12770 [Actinomycetes bacterium]